MKVRRLLNLSRKFTIVQLCETFHVLRTKMLNGRASRQTGFHPNLSAISPPLSVFSLLFFCSVSLNMSAIALSRPCCNVF